MKIYNMAWAPRNATKKGAGGQYDIKNKGAGKAEVLIYEDIGDGWLGGVSAKKFAEDLQALGSGIKEINVRINSSGGSVFDGVAIYNTLRNHGARIIVDIDGLAASIASIIAMAGDVIRMAENATMMIHNPWGVFAGDSAALREQADLLDKVRDQLLSTYAAQASASRETISELMDAESWLTAAEAFDAGLVDEVSDLMRVAAYYDLSKFKNTPAALIVGDSVVEDNETTDSDASVKIGSMAARISAMGIKLPAA